MRDLRSELLNESLAPSQLAAQTCALDRPLSCCDGVGYRMERSGAFAGASLCECVLTCSTCFGKMRRNLHGASAPCKEPSPGRVVNAINQAQIPVRYASARFDQFANFTGNGEAVVQRVSRWLKDFRPRDYRGLLLTGPVGVGKTYLLAAIAKNIAAKGRSVRFVDFFQLLGELKGAYSRDKADAEILEPLLSVDVLIIDELGKGRNNDWEVSILDQLVMGRYNQNRLIVASTNYLIEPGKTKVPKFNQPLDQGHLEQRGSFADEDFEHLETRVGKRIYSRLVEMCDLMNLSGENFRLKNQWTSPM